MTFSTAAEDKDWPFNQMSHDFKLLGAPSIDSVHIDDLTPLIFYRDFVAKNLPVVIDGALDKWPALKRWKSDAYLKARAGNEVVTIDFTPDGRGDSIVEGGTMFVTPVEDKMKFGDFINLLQRDKDDKEVPLHTLYPEAAIDPTIKANDFIPSQAPKPDGIPYCQHQNSSFATEFKFLHSDAALEMPFASEAFGSKPDAVNFWMVRELSVPLSSPASHTTAHVIRCLRPPITIYTQLLIAISIALCFFSLLSQGDSRAVSSMHSDPYENIYAVVCGEKHFTLLPPTDYYWLSRATLPRGQWHRKTKNEQAVDVAEKTHHAAGAGSATSNNSNSSSNSNSNSSSDETKYSASSSSTSTSTSSSSTSTSSIDYPADVTIGNFVAKAVEGADKVPWLDVDVDNPVEGDHQKVDFTQLCRFNITVKAGQVLYLPGQWFHAVRQQGRTIAVNFWYDMAYDGRFVLLEMMRNTADKLRSEQKEKRARVIAAVKERQEQLNKDKATAVAAAVAVDTTAVKVTSRPSSSTSTSTSTSSATSTSTVTANPESNSNNKT